jgi:hypothetical protein
MAWTAAPKPHGCADRMIPPRRSGWLARRWRGEVPARRLLWLDMLTAGTLLNLVFSLAALAVLSQRGPPALAVALHFAPLPYNAFLLAALWRSPQRTAGLAVAGCGLVRHDGDRVTTVPSLLRRQNLWLTSQLEVLVAHPENTAPRRPSIAVASAAGESPRWHQRLAEELRRTGHLAETLPAADGLVVVIGPRFASMVRPRAGAENGCFTLVREALAGKKHVLPLTVEDGQMPEAAELPPGIEALSTIDALALARESEVPAIAVRLAVALRQMAIAAPAAQLDERRIFISYRRDDAWYWSGLLASALAMRLGPGGVFLDVQTLHVGGDFDAEIRANIEHAPDFVIVVGRSFLAVDREGRRRIDKWDDPVRMEIREALRQKRKLHVVLIGGARMPDARTLPSDVAPAFEHAEPLALVDSANADAMAEKIVGSLAPPAPRPGIPFRIRLTSPQPPTGSIEFRTRKWLITMSAAAQGLSRLDWKPPSDRAAQPEGVLVRTGDDGFRFRLEPDRLEVVLEERDRSRWRVGRERWIKRAVFIVLPDDVWRLPDHLLEAAADPAAYLGRFGRMGPLLPVIRPRMQPGSRALEAHALERERIRARGGLRRLELEMTMDERGRVYDVAAQPSSSGFAVATDDGVLHIDPGKRTVRDSGLGKGHNRVAFAPDGSLAAAGEGCRLSVRGSDGRVSVDRNSPRSLGLRFAHASWFYSLSWSPDSDQIACCASDGLWMFHLHGQRYVRIPFPVDGVPKDSTSIASVFRVQGDMVMTADGDHLWRLSPADGKVLQYRDVAKGSDVFDAWPLPGGTRPGGLRVCCLAVSARGDRLAVGGSDAQIVQFDAATLRPLMMRVWHKPLVREANGRVSSLAFSSDGRWLAAVGNDQRVVVGVVESGDSVAEGLLSSAPLETAFGTSRVCWSADDTRIAVVTEAGRLEIWRAELVAA